MHPSICKCAGHLTLSYASILPSVRSGGEKEKVLSVLIFLFVYLFLVALGFELSGLGHSATPFSVMGFFEIGSCELFVWGWL
jgi:hypothetical protein